MKNLFYKCISSILLFTMLLSCVAVCAEDSVTVTVGKAECITGDTVEIPITLTGNTGFSSLGIEIDYDSDIFILTDAVNNPAVGCRYTPAKNFDIKPYTMKWINTMNIGFNGTIVTLKFKVNENAPNGSYPITISYDKGSDGKYIDGYDVNFDENFDALGLAYVNGEIVVNSAAIPSETPTTVPTAVPSETPTAIPSETPTSTPTAVPSETPTSMPTTVPTAVPSETPTAIPSETPAENVWSVSAIGNYANKVNIVYTPLDDKIEFTIKAIDGDVSDIANLDLFIAEYSEEYKLDNLIFGTSEIVDNALKITADMPKSDMYKVMIWNKNLVPIIEALTSIKSLVTGK